MAQFSLLNILFICFCTLIFATTAAVSNVAADDDTEITLKKATNMQSIQSIDSFQAEKESLKLKPSKKHVDIVKTGSGGKGSGGIFGVCRSGSCVSMLTTVKEKLLSRMKLSISSINRLFIGGPSDLKKLQQKLLPFARNLAKLRCGKPPSPAKNIPLIEERNGIPELVETLQAENSADVCPLVWTALSINSGAGMDTSGARALISFVKHRFQEHFSPENGQCQQSYKEKKSNKGMKKALKKLTSFGRSKNSTSKATRYGGQWTQDGDTTMTSELNSFVKGSFDCLNPIPIAQLDDALKIEKNDKMRKTTEKFGPKLVCMVEDRLNQLEQEEGEGQSHAPSFQDVVGGDAENHSRVKRACAFFGSDKYFKFVIIAIIVVLIILIILVCITCFTSAGLG